jgi:antitoxin CptB
MNERLAKLKWRCRRGMRELDSLLLAFVEDAAASFTEAELTRFEEILALPDPTLHAYLLGRSAPPDAATAALIERIRAAVRAPS